MINSLMIKSSERLFILCMNLHVERTAEGIKTLTKAKILKISKMLWQEINQLIFNYLTQEGDTGVRPPTSLFIFVLPPASHWHFHPTSHLPLPVSSFTILPIFSAKLSDSATVFVGVLNGASHTFRCTKIPHPTCFFLHLPHPTPDFHQHPASS